MCFGAEIPGCPGAGSPELCVECLPLSFIFLLESDPTTTTFDAPFSSLQRGQEHPNFQTVLFFTSVNPKF